MPGYRARADHFARDLSSDDLHSKLADVLQRFEETRLAIKQNVKMLGSIQDTSLDNHGFLPYSRSVDHGSHEMAGTGTSTGLRTMSSVDSGVMMTLNSCSSDLDTSRTRSYRSLDSWADTGQYSSSRYQRDSDCTGGCCSNTQVNQSSSDVFSSSGGTDEEIENCDDDDDGDDDDDDVNSESDDGDCVTIAFDVETNQMTSGNLSDHSNALVGDLEVAENPSRDCAVSNSELEEHPAEQTNPCKGEIGSVGIISEGPISDFSTTCQNDPSANSSADQSKDGCMPDPLPAAAPMVVEYQLFSSNNVSSLILSPSSSTPTTDKPLERLVQCIILPAKEKRFKSNRHTVGVDPTPDGWVERDKISVKRPTRPDSLPCALPSVVAPQERGLNDFRTMFSPIAEESSVELTPQSPFRRRKQLSIRSKNSSETAHSERNSAISSMSQKELQHRNQNLNAKDKHRKHKRKHRRYLQRAVPTHIISSSSSSRTSGNSSTSEESTCSYCHALRQHRFELPESNNVIAKKKVTNTSSTSSFTSMSTVRTPEVEFSSSVSSDDVPRFHYSLQHYANAKLGSPVESSRKAVAPIVKKLSRAKQTMEAPGNTPVCLNSPALTVSNKCSQLPAAKDAKERGLFKKNPLKAPLSKTMSDEASNSLLRYFRFPSPPAHEVRLRQADKNNEDAFALRHSVATTSPQHFAVNTAGVKPVLVNERTRVKGAALNSYHPEVYQQNPADRQKKKSRCGFFSLLFGKKETPRKRTADPKLLLDLREGEVRIKPQCSPKMPRQTPVNWRPLYPVSEWHAAGHSVSPFDRMEFNRKHLVIPAQQVHAAIHPDALYHRMYPSAKAGYQCSPQQLYRPANQFSTPVVNQQQLPHYFPSRFHRLPSPGLTALGPQSVIKEYHSSVSSRAGSGLSFGTRASPGSKPDQRGVAKVFNKKQMQLL